MILVAKDEFPPFLAIRLYLFHVYYFVASTGSRVLQAQRTHPTDCPLKPGRRRLKVVSLKTERPLVDPAFEEIHESRRPGGLPRDEAPYLWRNNNTDPRWGGS